MIEVEAETRLLTQRMSELAEVDGEIAKTQAALDRIDALPEVKAPDVLAAENARRRLRALEADRSVSVVAVEAARAALAGAERERDLAVVSAIRADVAQRRAALDAKMEAIAATDDIEESVFALLADDPFLARLRAEIAGVQSTLAPLAGIGTLTREEVEIDAGPWGYLYAGGGHAFFAAIVLLASNVRAAREAEERRRLEVEAAVATRMLEPEFSVDANGHTVWRYTEEQARQIPVPEEAIGLARADPHRAIAQFDAKYRSLIAAKDAEAAEALRSAARRNAAGVIPYRSAREGMVVVDE
jgi:hypothetical protein